ncbi:uncharacterized protein HD556DRAFT_1445722 [Suillus plorans]|uniref:CxC2-like cysteine cluster KDZ transposase-associated domain-containing protein n=1 Tax=Suillus plorans TaxID=116603 RepID=A0A9P7AK40_9AGAM|nr:uncharacterized protein HD556DRAFT_1445722 [Suillus plorans]KAG1790947.1 hypothetical protein HD556DRAFT_1445722 [Suillus plorans]
MGRNRRKKELDKLQKQWYDLNREYQAMQQAGRQHAADARLAAETGDNRFLQHKHQSHTIRGPSCLSTSTDYITSISVPSQVTPNVTDTGSNDFLSYFNDNEDAAYTIYDEHMAETMTEPKKRKRTAADNPIGLWTKECETYLLELLRLEGRGDYMFAEACPGTSECEGFPEYRCQDCFGVALYCKACTVARHKENPLHRIQHWVDGHFKCTSLKDLGLRIQLGHLVWGQCCNPSPAFHDDFIVLDVNGVHQVAVDFCACETAQSPTTQLLRARWFPATTIDPKTAAMFRLLHHFHILTFESKASAFEVWQTLSRLTDNTGIRTPKDRYEALLRMVREWRNIKLLKRFGRGHDPAGIDATLQGSCAVLCPACPQPGKNLPQGWEDAPQDVRWLYGLFLAIDANFRLARKNVSSDMADPGLSKGWAYFVEEHKYKMFLQGVSKQPQEKSTCVSHNAVNLAETKNSHGLAATGAGTVDCAHHNFKRPCAVGDLQKGEKYINMDYLFFSTMQHAKNLVTLNISYDIACQWNKHLWDRMSQYPTQMHIEHGSKFVTFLVPKFHLPAHIFACQIAYSHNLVKGMGRTDGEAPERGWANINPVATSTREMGPGSRRDTLDDHFGDFNWKKVTNIGISLLRKLKAAIPERNQHQRDFNEFNETLVTERTEEVAMWKQGVEKWETDMSATNPFSPTTATITQASVRLTLSQEEAQELEHGINNSLHHEISPAVLISSGIGIEEEQHRLLRDLSALGGHATDLQRSKLQDRMNVLQRKIEQWCQVQVLYMPSVAPIRTSRSSGSNTLKEEKAYEICLWLPSQLKDHAPYAICDERLCRFEWDLRRAQASDSLNDLRRHLLLRTHLYKFKDINIRGQRANTRAAAVIRKVEHNVTEAGKSYRRAWTALSRLCGTLGEDGWQSIFPVLEPAHVRGMSEGEAGQSEGNRTLSWIWKTQGVSAAGEVLADALRIEWCKARARANRWTEEVQLLLEEMRRVRAFLSWHAAWWDEQAGRRTGLPDAETEGIKGYAKRQASLRRNLQIAFDDMWVMIESSATAEAQM